MVRIKLIQNHPCHQPPGLPKNSGPSSSQTSQAQGPIPQKPEKIRMGGRRTHEKPDSFGPHPDIPWKEIREDSPKIRPLSAPPTQYIGGNRHSPKSDPTLGPSQNIRENPWEENRH